jgi:hypothetical protein
VILARKRYRGSEDEDTKRRAVRQRQWQRVQEEEEKGARIDKGKAGRGRSSLPPPASEKSTDRPKGFTLPRLTPAAGLLPHQQQPSLVVSRSN